jgi:hypothetical protein
MKELILCNPEDLLLTTTELAAMDETPPETLEETVCHTAAIETARYLMHDTRGPRDLTDRQIDLLREFEKKQRQYRREYHERQTEIIKKCR